MRASSSLTSSLQPWYMSSSANWNREEERGRMFIIRGTLFMLRLLWRFQAGKQAKRHKRFMKFISAGHNVSSVIISDTFLKPCLPHGEFSHPGVSHLSVSCFSFASRATVGKKKRTLLNVQGYTTAVVTAKTEQPWPSAASGEAASDCVQSPVLSGILL